jgi:hypothetical protein
VRCGEVGQPAFREGGGIVCSRCNYRDPARRRPCARCAALAPLATILRGLNKLRAAARHDELEVGNDRNASRGLIGSPFGASATLVTSGGQRP